MIKINKESPWQDLTHGGTMYDAGNSLEFKTGDWRSVKPIYIEEKCKQCGLCFPVCPENAIPVNKEQKERILIMTIAKVVAFVPMFALLMQ